MTICQLRRCLLALLFAALAGPSLAQSLAAGSFDDGMRAYDAGDHAKAVELWAPLAEGGDAIAQYSLGKVLENGGGGVERNLAEAAKWYDRAAGQGVPAAQNNLGLMYAQGRGVPRDSARAARLWLSAADKDHVIAQFNLGLAYYRGEGVEEDKTVAVRWFRRASELGLADAQYALAQIMRVGLIEGDEGEALIWYQLAADQGHAKAKAQAEQLRKAGVKPKAMALPATAAAAKSAAPEAAAPEPAAPEPAAAESPTPEAAVRGPYRIWLISLKDEAEAGRYLRAARTKHPAIFAEARGAVARADLGAGGVVHRVVADGLPSREAARGLCRRLRAAEPGAFCKVLAN